VTAANMVAGSYRLPPVTASTTGVYANGPSIAMGTNPFLRRNANRPIFDKGTLSWESVHVEEVSVMKDATEYKMWYSGCDNSHCQIGLAHAPLNPSNGKPWWDPSNWTRDPANPVIRNSMQSFMSAHAYSMSVVKTGSTYYMVVAGHNGTLWRLG